MEAIKKHFFWLAMLVLVIGGLAAYYMTVPALQDDTEAKKKETQEKKEKADSIKAKISDIKNANYESAAEGYQAHLEKQESDMRKLWRENSKGLVLGEDFEKAPSDSLKFDTEWLAGRRDLYAKKCADAGVALPKDFNANFLYDGKPTPADPKERTKRVRNVALLDEVLNVLCSTKMEVTRFKFTANGEDEKEKVQKGAASFDDLVIFEADDAAKRDAFGPELALRVAGAGQESLSQKDKPKGLVTGMQLEVRFSAPVQLVPTLLQKLESSSRYLGVIRKVDTQRAAKVMPETAADFLNVFKLPDGYKQDTPAPTTTFAVGGVEKDRFINSRYDEAPIQVLVVLDLLTLGELPARAGAGK